ncbi:M23 family metallopeptidase [Streptomyces sp. LP05-1]|uniref:M23 family metallopeptidase n=1 Tax=Streptomyces pyxinae TaxID=2970734 RepID=A0ABT2CGM2_9ACTN|nr:M23 family metallopeptidase [Streptomyces sp. LP05-1]MCS0636562.1 M23 family metallopeptidase [Streptomyces sp. LP05-1]
MHRITLLLALAAALPGLGAPASPPSPTPAPVPARTPAWVPAPARSIPAPAPAEGTPGAPDGPPSGVWPLGPPRPAVVWGWEPPATPYGPGHRGVDLAAPPGAPVWAAAAGRVTFAGPVGGRGALTITLAATGDPPLRVTYEPVRPLVARDSPVAAGQRVAVTAAGRSHCAGTCLHWGLRRGDQYLNPLSLLPPHLLRGAPSRLLPLWAAGTVP